MNEYINIWYYIYIQNFLHISEVPYGCPHMRIVVILQSHDLICHQKKLNIKGGITCSAIIHQNSFIYLLRIGSFSLYSWNAPACYCIIEKRTSSSFLPSSYHLLICWDLTFFDSIPLRFKSFLIALQIRDLRKLRRMCFVKNLKACSLKNKI